MNNCIFVSFSLWPPSPLFVHLVIHGYNWQLYLLSCTGTTGTTHTNTSDCESRLLDGEFPRTTSFVLLLQELLHSQVVERLERSPLHDTNVFFGITNIFQRCSSALFE